MGLLPELCKALSDMKINTPTTIQEASLPLSLAGEPKHSDTGPWFFAQLSNRKSFFGR
jgi:superfamily II DNA/RNA helicase